MCTWGTPDACEIQGGKKEGAEIVCAGIDPVLNTASHSLCSARHPSELSSDLGKEWRVIPRAQTAFGRGRGRPLSSASVTNIHFPEERWTQRFVMLLCVQNCSSVSGDWSVLGVLIRLAGDMGPWAVRSTQ